MAQVFKLVLRVYFALVNPGFYLPLMPAFLPAHVPLIYLSGVAELFVGAGVLLYRYPVVQALSVRGIIALLLVFTPIHILDYAKDTPFVGSKKAAVIRLFFQAVMLAGAFYLL